ncbi:MAG: Chemotaxis protein methyltransferase [Deltaproteobacteria bacterium ADurb.Bin510]|nr:MAG: Chemotaxis protein methyltransferase [Deltaproteobacteria bacterium ADurb.Bin510]
MSAPTVSPGFTAPAAMQPEIFAKLSGFIHEQCGIRMPASKQVMLEARLGKRLKQLGLKDYAAYWAHLSGPDGAYELPQLLDAVTTNKTDFFREARHFEYLVNECLPTLRRSIEFSADRPLMLWSAACSSGEEPYTLAMVLDDYARRNPGFEFMILATDISNRVLEMGRRAVYAEERILPVAAAFRQRYLLRSKTGNGLVRICPELRARVRFRRLNFMAGDFGLRERMDVIFCRNVLIYFDHATQEQVINRLCQHLAPGGYLFTGHSESTNGMRVPLKTVANTVSRRV